MNFMLMLIAVGFGVWFVPGWFEVERALGKVAGFVYFLGCGFWVMALYLLLTL